MWVKLIKQNIIKSETRNNNDQLILKIKSIPKEIKNFEELKVIMKDYDDFEILEK